MTDWLNEGIATHRRLVDALAEQTHLIEEITQVIIDALEAGNRIYILGNGGSAADAQHIAAEFIGRFQRERRPLPALALTTDTSILTSIGNDYGFQHTFRRQVEGLVEPGDVLWALSTSGNSPNVVDAAQTARLLKATIVGFTGGSGGKLKSLSDYCLCVDHDTSDRIQEIHQVAYHLICDGVEAHFATAED